MKYGPISQASQELEAILRAAVDAVLDDSLRRGGQTRFRGVTADAQAFLEEQYPGRFRFTPYRDSFD